MVSKINYVISGTVHPFGYELQITFKILECGDLTFANGELVGTDNGVGAERTIVCNTGYKEELGETEVRCDKSGNWNYTPVCKTSKYKIRLIV